YHSPSLTMFYTLSLHDALPIYPMLSNNGDDFDTYYQVRAINTYFNVEQNEENYDYVRELFPENAVLPLDEVKKVINRSKKLGKADRKSTRLNSSHVSISYAVFC